MLLIIKNRNKVISLEQLCNSIQDLKDYVEIIADLQKIMDSTANRFRLSKQRKIYEQCKFVYNVLSSNTYTVNDLYFATEFLIKLSEANAVNTVKEREIFSKTTEILVNICSKILESKIEASDLCLKCHVMSRKNRDMFERYDQKLAVLAFYGRFHEVLPTV